MSKEEIVEIFDRFIQETGAWTEFVAWLEAQGYKPEELGFPKDE